MSIELKAVHIGYSHKKGHKRIAGPISLEMPKGSLTAVVGLNGSGKTTLIKSIAKHLPLLEGSLTIEGTSIQKINTQKLAKILSVVLTNALASENMSVYELVSTGRHPYLNWYGRLAKKDHEIIEEALAFTNMKEIAFKKIHELSEGQKQKALIAKALAQDTPYMILDEPMAHLDLHHKAQLIALLKKLVQQKNKTVILSTHDIENALKFAHNILVITKDQCVAGTPKTLIETQIFEQLFPTEHIIFNAQTKQFLFRGLDTK